MQIPSMQRRNLIFLVALLILLFTVFHLHTSSNNILNDHSDEVDLPPVVIRPPPPKDDPIIPSSSEDRPDPIDKNTPVSPPLQPPPPPLSVLPNNDSTDKQQQKDTSSCDAVNFNWLASDRKHWDGWASKSMFMSPEGNFTTKNVFIKQDESICVVVLLGPIPAKSAIRPEEHLAPADSLVMTAVGQWTHLSITLQQHPRQTNVYFASVPFTHQDNYQLDTRIEYRSYFWETPTKHYYRPYRFLSSNKLIVKAPLQTLPPELPACTAQQMSGGEGAWMAKAEYQRMYPLDFYGMFGVSQEDHAVNNRLFVPNHCRPQYISLGQAAQCLEGKTVHVWADNNIRRNLKVFSSGNRWCSDPTDVDCICNDDEEDHETLYPWAIDPTIPLEINETWHANTQFYFHPVSSILAKDWKQEIKQASLSTPKADLVLIHFGNDDIALRHMSPGRFADAFRDLLSYLVHDVYPMQRIIVRTPQPFCCGTIYSTSWNAGRSEAFTKAVRDAVDQFPSVLLWDVHRLGMTSHMCVSIAGTPYTTRSVLNVENLQLWNLVCAP
ncbi:hypothetical protein BDA99DRAFT_564762 [Phascolomyces articulosus]|uniref:Uncharacterized protein n=1 Tax=Phascolomyces articulosus TaxID=60185 RepID=A0AAD5P8N8_9FUNG|nr:hypothetical protein BDA99DRAFT_564762 [Phascolomyces articulosus]